MSDFPKITSETLYKRLLAFAQKSQKFITILPKTIYNIEYGKQLIRSSASPGSNYIEAIEAGSRREFTHRLRICRKEVKESVHWLKLIESANNNVMGLQEEINEIIQEAQQLIKIFTSSIITSERNREINK